MAAQKRTSSIPNQQDGTPEAHPDDHSASVGETSSTTNTGRKAMEGRVIRGSKGIGGLLDIGPMRNYDYEKGHFSFHKAPDIQICERKNWLIHLHYIRKDFETCKVSELARRLVVRLVRTCSHEGAQCTITL